MFWSIVFWNFGCNLYSKFVRLGHMLPRSWVGTSVLEFWIRVLVSRARSGIMAGRLFFRFTCQKNNFNARLFPPSALFLISFPTLALPPQCWVHRLTHVFWCWAAFILSGWYIDYSNLQWIWHVCFQFVPQPSPDPATAFPNQFACWLQSFFTWHEFGCPFYIPFLSNQFSKSSRIVFYWENTQIFMHKRNWNPQKG